MLASSVGGLSQKANSQKAIIPSLRALWKIDLCHGRINHGLATLYVGKMITKNILLSAYAVQSFCRSAVVGYFRAFPYCVALFPWMMQNYNYPEKHMPNY